MAIAADSLCLDRWGAMQIELNTKQNGTQCLTRIKESDEPYGQRMQWAPQFSQPFSIVTWCHGDAVVGHLAVTMDLRVLLLLCHHGSHVWLSGVPAIVQAMG